MAVEAMNLLPADAPLAMLQELLDAPADQVPIFAPVIGPAASRRRYIVCRSWRTSTSRQPSADVIPGLGGTSTDRVATRGRDGPAPRGRRHSSCGPEAARDRISSTSAGSTFSPPETITSPSRSSTGATVSRREASTSSRRCATSPTAT